MTLFLQAFYVSFHKDIDFKKYGSSIEAEKNLPFKMSEMYVSRGKHI